MGGLTKPLAGGGGAVGSLLPFSPHRSHTWLCGSGDGEEEEEEEEGGGDNPPVSSWAAREGIFSYF